MGPASFNVVAFIVQSAATLRQALSVVQKYQSLISDGGRFQLLPGPTASWLVYHPRQATWLSARTKLKPCWQPWSAPPAGSAPTHSPQPGAIQP